ncbi:helix-turn-helix transcriptional regulator [Eleftheria terrae]|uniref:helix-turn-helix transcriptional regulator n=1 Tax=Eleftheria terrae TaxID=1597781 RepID=UPI00263B3296|nr:LuxR C-terminal-related transcriptional regulator [Eleftheria terrae]WKB53071.1 LuxR C-terminal-related transcriptional regulator [Eleftheria terrae]
MSDTIFAPARADPPAESTPRPVPYGSALPRTSLAADTRWLAAALDEIDYGALILDEQAHTLHLNRMARFELQREDPLLLVGGQLHTRRCVDAAVLYSALRTASARGLRKLLALGDADHRLNVSVVPLGTLEPEGPRPILLLLGKREVCTELSIQGYAGSHGLTSTESRVLTALSAGTRPDEIARLLGVAIATIRSHIASVRTKTATDSIGTLMRQLAVLPPLMGVLPAMWRSGAAGGASASHGPGREEAQPWTAMWAGNERRASR